jgi:hypothetical protein
MNRRPRPGRTLVAAAVMAAAVSLASACGASSSAPETSSAAQSLRFENSYLTFRHPVRWKTYPFRWTGGLHFRPMLYVSTQPVRDPCRTQGAVLECGWPVGRLQPDGVLIVWENRGFPGWSLRTTGGTPLRVGGRNAKRRVTRPGVCGAIGGDATVEVQIERAVHSNWTNVTACVRGPHLATSERKVDALLATTQFLAP